MVKDLWGCFVRLWGWRNSFRIEWGGLDSVGVFLLGVDMLVLECR